MTIEASHLLKQRIVLTTSSFARKYKIWWFNLCVRFLVYIISAVTFKQSASEPLTA